MHGAEVSFCGMIFTRRIKEEMERGKISLDRDVLGGNVWWSFLHKGRLDPDAVLYVGMRES